MLRALLLIGALGFFSQSAFAEPSAPNSNIRLSDIGIVYAAQWTIYGITQAGTIREHARLNNLIEYPSQPQFDKDDFNYNIVKHAVAGQYYYLFYRSRGYAVEEAFMATFVSSLAFEFTIETLTERPSFQDIYQTPVFGTVLGVGVEHLSENLRSSDSRLLQTIGIILNPFVLLQSETSSVKVIPILSPEHQGISLAGKF